MNKYQKMIDYDKHEAHYFCNDNGIVMETSKDIIIDELQERINKAIEYINNLSNEPNAFGHYGIDSRCKEWLLKILKGEDK